MIRILLLLTLFVSTTSFAQKLWGSLRPGKHAVGFKLIHERDNTRGGIPITVGLWYPAKASGSAKAVSFKDYFENAEAAVDFHRTMERPFIANATIPNEKYEQVLNIKTAAKWDLPEADGKFPAVLMGSETESLSVTAEFLASNGFVVAAVNAPYGPDQPADSLLWVQPTANLLWLKNYSKNLEHIDQSKLNALGFGGGIQSPFFLTMKTDDIRGLVNLDGGVFGPRSLTDKSVEYDPSKMNTPMLHIVTTFQQKEDDVNQLLAPDTRLYKANIQNEGLRHHDFSIYGRVLNKGLGMRGSLGDIADQTYAAAHKLILDFLAAPSALVIDRRYMPFINLENVQQQPGLVLHQPGMNKVMIEGGNPFRTVNDTTLLFDIYYPKNFDKKTSLPVVVFVNGIGSLDLYRWRIYQDWSRLIAANGMIAVSYQTRRNHAFEDSDAILDYLSGHSNELAIDKDKIGLWACSANVTTGLPLAMQEKRANVKGLVVYYGTAQPNFKNRQGIEMQIVRAGLDFHNLNAGMENFVKQALLEDLHFEYINYPEGQHAFDAFDDTPRSREIILQTVDFLERTLSKDHPVPAPSVLTNNRIWTGIITEKKIDETLKEWKDAVAMYRKLNHSQWYNHVIDERNLNQVGYQLMEAGRNDDALKVFTANQEQFSESANVYDALADVYEKIGNKQQAIANARKALEKLDKQTELPPQFKAAIRQSAEDKIRRLQ